jgi:nitrile hydratase
MSGDHGSAAVAAQVRGVEALLERKGLIDPVELDRALQAFLARASPASGARVVARAWLDDGFRQRLLADANAALPEVGLSMGGRPAGAAAQGRAEHGAHAQRRGLHHVLVLPDRPARPVPHLVQERELPVACGPGSARVLAEFGFELDPALEVTVWDASAESRYMVLPRRPAGTEELDETQLAALVTRDGLLGVAAV